MASSVSKRNRVPARYAERPSQNRQPPQIRRDWARCRIPTTSTPPSTNRRATLLARLRRYFRTNAEVKVKRAGFERRSKAKRDFLPALHGVMHSVYREASQPDGWRGVPTIGEAPSCDFSLDTTSGESDGPTRFEEETRGRMDFRGLVPQGTLSSARDYRRSGTTVSPRR